MSVHSARRGPLGRLDDAFVPRLQRGSRAFAHALAAPLRGTARWERGLAGGSVIRGLWPRRRFILFCAVVLVFLGSLAHARRFIELRDAREAVRARDEQQTVRPAGGGETPAGRTLVGPRAGIALAGYLEDAATRLSEAAPDEERLAIASFHRYLTADEAAAVVADVDARAVQLRLPEEQQEPIEVEVVGDDVAASVVRVVERERARIVDEEQQIRELVESGTVTDPEYAAFYQAELDRLTNTRNVLDSGGGVVYAVVVDGPVSALRRLAEHEDVRVVDLADARADADRTRFAGVLPEDRARSSRPPPR